MKNSLKVMMALLLSVIMAMFLTSCSGGDSDGDDDGNSPGDTTVPTASVAPPDNSTIGATTQMVITFSESMDTATLVIGGSMAAEDNGGVWSTINYTNDTLTISPATSWTEGSAKTLAIDASDTAGNSMTMLSLSYTVDSTPPTVTITSHSDGDQILQQRSPRVR
jgi:PBP1b-binding outer membrane lipoprotein LpoB